jgi:hypothetical protein
VASSSAIRLCQNYCLYMKNSCMALTEPERTHLRNARHDSIAAVAAAMAGSDLDLDAEMETAALEYLASSTDS